MACRRPQSVAIVMRLMENLAIAVDGLQQAPASPTRLLHQAYTPALRINPDSKIVARVSRERKWILFLQ
jgi:hypothetical protein